MHARQLSTSLNRLARRPACPSPVRRRTAAAGRAASARGRSVLSSGRRRRRPSAAGAERSRRTIGGADRPLPLLFLQGPSDRGAWPRENLPGQGGARNELRRRLARGRGRRCRFRSIYEDVLPRFFMFTLKGYAYLQMRLGDLDEGRAAVEKLLDLDPATRSARGLTARASLDGDGSRKMMTDIDEAIDWRARQVDCASCAHRGIHATGAVGLPHACVHDRYARRIDRFFNWNPELAKAISRIRISRCARSPPSMRRCSCLPPLLDDPEETVRWNAARRLPKRYILRLRTDPHREVRIRIVIAARRRRSDPDDCTIPDYYVRLVIARRIAAAICWHG